MKSPKLKQNWKKTSLSKCSMNGVSNGLNGHFNGQNGHKVTALTLTLTLTPNPNPEGMQHS